MSWSHTGQFNDIGVIMKRYNVSEILHQPPTLDIYQDESRDNSPRLGEKGGHFTFPPQSNRGQTHLLHQHPVWQRSQNTLAWVC